jgi:MFS family permease
MISKHITQFIKNYEINPVIKILIVSDFLIWSSNQLFAPIFAIFVTNNLYNGNIEVVGFSAGIYLFIKSIFEIPIGMFVDKKKGEFDDLTLAFLGTFFTGIIIFLFSYIKTVNQLYILQGLLGLSAAIAYPGWYSIFTRHIDKNKEAFEWSLYDVLLAMGMALASALGGMLAQRFGFSVIFIISAVSTILGAFLLLLIRKKLFKK